jgi:MoaA/NifB/PqqE/SkfB family radical SAM enzyme
MNENFCHHPWVGLEVNPQGQFRPCCKYIPSLADNLSDYQTSTELAILKDAFLSGQKPPGCKYCWDDEAAGIPSKRQLDNQYLFNHQSPDYSSLKVLSFSFGNSCNLACRTCDSSSSSTWIIEEKALKNTFPNIKIHQHRRFYQDSKFIDQIKSISDNLLHVEFPGGEPFLAGVNEHLDFLDFLLTTNPQDISLHYMTNATIFPQDYFWDRWAKFKKVDIQLSIDGTGAQFEYIRWPAKWSEVENNLKLYADKKDNCDNMKLSISHTVSIFNVYYLPEFVKWCLQNKFDMPYLGLVADPKMYNIRNLPAEVKDAISKKISRFKLENIVSYMYDEDLSVESNWSMTAVLDQQRKQSFKETFPEFYQLLKEAECQI